MDDKRIQKARITESKTPPRDNKTSGSRGQSGSKPTTPRPDAKPVSTNTKKDK